MLEYYHTGVFGKDVANQWSCCKIDGRTSDGCMPTKLYEVVPPRIRSAIINSDRESYSLMDDEVSLSVPAGWPTEHLPPMVPNVYVYSTKKDDRAESGGKASLGQELRLT